MYMKHYLVIKRFSMDDVPVLLTHEFVEAEEAVTEIEKAMDQELIYATEAEQPLMRLDIGSELISVGIITFGDSGLPEAHDNEPGPKA